MFRRTSSLAMEAYCGFRQGMRLVEVECVWEEGCVGSRSDAGFHLITMKLAVPTYWQDRYEIFLPGQLPSQPGTWVFNSFSMGIQAR